MQADTRHNCFMGKLRAWLQSWRNGLRLGETAVVIGLWTGGIAASDVVIAQVLLIAGLVFGVVAIFADPASSREKSLGLSLALFLSFGVAEGIYFFRKSSPSPAVVTEIRRDTIRYYPVQSKSPTPAVSPSYQIVIKDAPPTRYRPVDEASGKNSDASLAAVLSKMARRRVASEASMICEIANNKFESSAYVLINQAVNLENNYAYTRDGRQMEADLNSWVKQVQVFLAANKEYIPDSTQFDEATNRKTAPLFGRQGFVAWETMDAKRAALNDLRLGATRKDCEAIGKAAIAECEAKKTCEAIQSPSTN